MKRTTLCLLLAFLALGTSSGLAQTTGYIGTNGTTNNAGLYPAPYGLFYTCSKHQMLILASELQAEGFAEGFITSLGFDVLVPNGVALEDFTLKIKPTGVNSLASFDNVGLTTVFGPVDYVDIAGWNVHNFDDAFYWDGSSNLIVETCFCNGVSNSSLNAEMRYTPTGFNSVVYTRVDNDANHCTNVNSPFIVSDRPNMQIEGFVSATADAGVLAIMPPADACGLSDSEMVSVSIQNYGTDTIFSLNVYYRIDGGSPVMEVVNDTIVIAVPETYTFTTPADLSSPGVHTIDAWTGLVSDVTTFNDSTIGELVEHYAVVSAFPLLEDFESQGACLEQCGSVCPISGVWVNDASSDINWVVDAGGTPTSGTGPANDHTLGSGAGQYIYTESSGCGQMEAILLASCIDFDAVANPGLNFYYFMYGDSTGQLHVEVDSAGVWLNLLSVTGQQQASENDAWLNASIDLSQITGTTSLRIRAVTGTETSDIALDDLLIYDVLPDDVGVVALVAPSNGCNLSSEVVTITVKNYGSVAQDTIPVAYSLNAGPAVVDTVFGSLVPLGTVNFTFSTLADLSLVGMHSIDAWTQLSTDAVVTNNSFLGTQMENYGTIATYPFVYDIESESNCGVMCGDPCALSGGWENLTTDDIDWAVDLGGTSTPTTGPAVDHTLGTTAGKYLYLEANSCAFMEAVLLSPCVDLVGMAYPTIEFYYHMYGGDMGELHLEYDSNGTWMGLMTVMGQAQSSSGASWTRVNIDLAAYSTATRFRIRGITGAGISSDLAIDDLRIYDRPSGDVGVMSIDSPTGSCLNATETVTIQVKNFGSEAVDTIPVTYTINGAAPVTEVIIFTLLPDSTLTYSFTGIANLTSQTVYVFESWTSLNADGDLSNDTTTTGSLNGNITQAAFSFSDTVICKGSPNSFTDLSSNSPISWAWDFGNGDSSFIQNPTYVYGQPGVYTVTLFATNACNTDSIVLNGAITVTGGNTACNPSVIDIANDIGIKNVVFDSISNTTDTLDEGYAYYGCDYSTTIFAGSSQTLTVTTGSSWPEHVRAWLDYNNDGVFDTSELILSSDNTLEYHSVQFIVQNGVVDTVLTMRIASEYGVVSAPGPCDTLVFGQVEDYAVTIVNASLPPEAAFFSDVIDYCIPTVQFTDNSTYFPSTWNWDFGDGVQSTASQVTHVFPSPGTYSVTLVVSNSFGNDTVIQSVYIDTLSSAFIIPDTVEQGENVLFDNTSYGANSYLWDFGDMLGSPTESPNHSYSVPGMYYISLIATDSVNGCSNTSIDSMYVQVINALEDMDIKSSISISPNPSSGILTFSFSFDRVLDLEISIVNMLGEQVYVNHLGAESDARLEIDLSNKAQGVYMFMVKLSQPTGQAGGSQEGTGYQFSEKIIIQH